MVYVLCCVVCVVCVSVLCCMCCVQLYVLRCVVLYVLCLCLDLSRTNQYAVLYCYNYYKKNDHAITITKRTTTDILCATTACTR